MSPKNASRLIPLGNLRRKARVLGWGEMVHWLAEKEEKSSSRSKTMGNNLIV